MRLHRLRLHAFGPFPGTEQIDFDALSADGLHLIHGPTGAGKTSILDAICFALFAAVPGGRAGGRPTLRSDHAAPSAIPEVELDFSVGDRRLRVRRSPEHVVPKKRGTGTRTQRGSVQLEEFYAPNWHTVSTRADEAAQLIGDLLGMGLSQFAQVMLLPQGEFTAFLRAKADDRGKLLERLFDISEFAAVEHWLTEHRKSLDLRVTRADAHRAELVSRAWDALGGIPIDAVGPGEFASADSVDGLRRLSSELSDRLTAALAEADVARAEVDAARARLAHERALAALQQQARAAQRTLERLSGQAPELAQAAGRLELAQRADLCRPAFTALDRRRTAHQKSLAAADNARRDLRKVTAWAVPEVHGTEVHGGILTAAAVDPLRERAIAGTEALAGQPELLRQLRSLQGQLSAATAEHDEAAREHDAATTVVDSGATRLTEVARLRDAQLPIAGASEQWRTLLDALDAVAAVSATVTCDLHRVDETGKTYRDARHKWARAEAELLELRRTRLAGIAAELAADLQDGQPCPVCGSPAHPHAAQPSPDRVDADRIAVAEGTTHAASVAAERAAAGWSAAVGRAQSSCHSLRSAVDALLDTDQTKSGQPGEADENVTAAMDSVLDVLRVHRPALASLVAALDAQSAGASAPGHQVVGDLIDALADARGSIARQTSASTAAAERLHALDLEVEALTAQHLAAERAATTAAESERAALSREASLQGRLTATQQRVDELSRAHGQCCGCSTDADPRAAHARCVRLLDELVATTSAARATVAELRAAEGEVARVLTEREFSGAADATAAMLSASAQRDLQAAVEAAATDRLKATGVLEQPEVEAAAAAAPAEVDRAATETAAAESLARHTRDAVGDLRRTLQTLQRIAASLAEHDGLTTPLRDQLAVATSLASAVTGSGDNTMRMRLTAYVLAARLETVTSLANERLLVMTSGRYQLEHTDAKTGRGKSGLGLQVRDAWTGTARDTGTLSGGESFIASLALALGLGDAVLQAAGGRRLDTLLVDEGFGSLDEDSMEQVLDVLDGLRSGGRSVGIVSHVAELRSRIPAQIRVHKTASGSTLEVRAVADVA